ncbi:MAG: molecular chaperone HtpG, partial [Deltaproteobacteria bacterium]|nr:molecular chaperone HtpG [Deltaproteobacteria bacterium]
KILKSSGQSPEKAKRILELNMEHPALARFKSLFEKDQEDPRLKDYSHLIYDMAVISEGGKIDDPADFSKRVGELMADAMAQPE